MSQIWPLLSGITRKVRKLALLSCSRNFRGGGALLSELYGIFQRSSDEMLQDTWAFDAVLTSVFVIHRWVFRAMVRIPNALQCSSDEQAANLTYVVYHGIGDCWGKGVTLHNN